MAQITIADIITILAVPIVLQPGRVGHVILGGLYVAGAAVVLFLVARLLSGHEWVHSLRHKSKQRRWALDLRLSLLVLFVLAWIAQKGGTSILIAGFAAGLMVAVIGGPKRLSTQVRGIADGFFVPLYFVVLGAQLDLAGLVSHPSMLALAGALAVLNVAIHLLAARVGASVGGRRAGGHSTARRARGRCLARPRRALALSRRRHRGRRLCARQPRRLHRRRGDARSGGCRS